MTEDFRKFIEEYRDMNPDRLRMRFHGDNRQWLPLAISHIEALKKGRKKYPGLPESWIYPSVTAVEQSTPRLTAAYNHEVASAATRKHSGNCRILDMTAGMGMDALGFAADGADLTLIEINPIHAEALAENFGGYKNVTVIKGDSVKWLSEHHGSRFDIIFIDPARRDSAGTRAYNLHDCTPDLVGIAPLILDNAEVCIAKLSPMLDLTQTLRDLPDCKELHIVEEGGECRELLAVLSREESGAAPVITVHKENFTVSYHSGTASGGVSFSAPEAGLFLMEPSPVVIKGLPAWKICGYGLDMLAPNSHIFIGAEITEPMLGRWSMIENVADFAGSKLKNVGKSIGAAEVVARNLPGMTSESLRKKLGIKESSARRIIGTTLADGRKVLITTKRL